MSPSPPRSIWPTISVTPPRAETFQSLPAFPGVEVDLHASAGGCTDTVEPADPAAFIDHYERVMRDAGWRVARDGAELRGTGPAGRVHIDSYEGNEVVVLLPSTSDYSPYGP